MHYDDKSSLLEGVPAAADAKRSVTVKLVTIDSGHSEKVVDQFSIDVLEDGMALSSDENGTLWSADDRLPRPIRCLPTSAVTTATVVIDADADGASGAERACTVRAFARHLDLPVAAVRYLPAGKAPLDDLSLIHI